MRVQGIRGEETFLVTHRIGGVFQLLCFRTGYHYEFTRAFGGASSSSRAKCELYAGRNFVVGLQQGLPLQRASEFLHGANERGETTGSKIMFSLSRLKRSEWIPAFF